MYSYHIQLSSGNFRPITFILYKILHVYTHTHIHMYTQYILPYNGKFWRWFQLGDLAILESTAKLKIAKFLSSVHAQYAMRINRQILNSPITRFGYFAKI